MPKIKIHYSVIFLFLVSLFTDNFVKFSLLIICILIHELAHFLVLSYYKKQLVTIEISLIGGIMTADKDGLSLKAKLLINFAGVGANLLIIIFLKLININQAYLVYYNILMILFNLIPIIPLDGYQILNDILLNIYDEEYTFVIIKTIDICCLIILGIIFVWFKIYGLIFIWIFLFYKLIKYNIDIQKIKKYLWLYINN